MMLEFSDVSKIFPGPDGPITAMDQVNLSVDTGEFAAICGPSGCGKSTLLLTAGALLSPSGGTVCLDGRDVYAGAEVERRRLRARQLGFVFQQFHLLPYLSVRDNILAPSVAAPDAEVGCRADQLLERFGLTERANHLPAQLSTGEKQRTALARALLNQPSLVLADEPTGNLDPDNARAVLQALAEFAEAGGAVLMVTHEQAAAAYAQRVLWLRKGRISNA